MDYSFTDRFDKTRLTAGLMGPNAMRIAEELAGFLSIEPGMRVLDLGCGAGLSSVLLVQKYGAFVFATDLWITPTDNAERFDALGLGDRVVPISADATKGLPFANRYFDVFFCVDAYHYFGANETMLPTLLKHLKPGAQIAVAVPGLKEEFTAGVPKDLKPFWQPGMNFHSTSWWEALWQKTPGVELETVREMDCFHDAWQDWLVCPNPYAKTDVKMMEAEGGRYFNLVQLTARVC